MAKWYPTPQLHEMALLPGASVPGSKANSSSRGRKALPTGRAGSVGAQERDALSSIALERSQMLASRLQRHLASGASWGFSPRFFSPGSARTLLRGILEQLRF